MSVRAYILRKIDVNFTEENIIFKKIMDNKPLFNVWHNPKIFEIFLDYGCDFSNQDSLGEIMITRSDWMEFKKDFKNEGWTEEELEILNTINNELKEEEDIWCECF